jgi:hypothetical protein
MSLLGGRSLAYPCSHQGLVCTTARRNVTWTRFGSWVVRLAHLRSTSTSPLKRKILSELGIFNLSEEIWRTRLAVLGSSIVPRCSWTTECNRVSISPWRMVDQRSRITTQNQLHVFKDPFFSFSPPATKIFSHRVAPFVDDPLIPEGGVQREAWILAISSILDGHSQAENYITVGTVIASFNCSWHLLKRNVVMRRTHTPYGVQMEYGVYNVSIPPALPRTER